MKITLEIDMNNSKDTEVLISCIQELLRNIQKEDNNPHLVPQVQID